MMTPIPPPPPFPGTPLGDATPPPPSALPGSVETLTGGPPPTFLGNFMDTRLSWTFGDDDVLHATGLAYPLSPNASIGDRPQYRLFFDNLNSRFAGRENLTHLALYKKMPGFIPRLDTEASMVLRFDFTQLGTNTNNVNQAFYDAGSFIRLFYHTDGNAEGKVGLGLTLWPIDTDRFRLGYLYDITWGGTNAYINQFIFPRIQGSAPGAKLQYDGDGWNLFAGFKTAGIVQLQETLAPGTSEVEQIHLTQTNVGVLGGGAFDIGDYVAPRRRRRLLPAGQVRSARRRRPVGLHLRRLGAPRRPRPEHAAPAVGRPLALPQRSQQTAGHLQARGLQPRQDDLAAQRRDRPALPEPEELRRRRRHQDPGGARRGGPGQHQVRLLPRQPHGHLPRSALRPAQPAELHPLRDHPRGRQDHARGLLRGGSRLLLRRAAG